MTALFLGCFLGGLVLAVISMLTGVERRGAPLTVAATSSMPRVRLTRPVVSAFAILFGVLGYLLTRHTTLGPATRLVIAAVAGGLGVVGSILLVAKWAVRGGSPVDHELLQGHVATVTRGTTSTAPAQITYELDGVTTTVDAVSIDDSELAKGTEVVIERIDNGLAYVEAWSRVEERL
jgi:hypothetical protein